MYQFKNKEDNEIEIVLSRAVTSEEFTTMIEQIESLSPYKPYVNIIFDTRELQDHYTFKILLDEHNFSKKYKSHLSRVAFVSDEESEVFLLEQFVKNPEPEFKTFNRIEEARKWVGH